VNTLEKEKIRYLRSEGLGYKAIASRLDLSVDAVKGFCRREGLDGKIVESTGDACRQCGMPLIKSGARQKKFCSDTCRSAWWNSRTYLTTPKEENMRVCIYCGHVFYSSQKAKKKYCGHPCYIAARFGGERL